LFFLKEIGGNSHAEIGGNSHVEIGGNSHVEIGGNMEIRSLNNIFDVLLIRETDSPL
jgi:hypothetical protein